MTQWFALSAIGRDRPGIVADLAELIYECDCNLEDSSMTILGSEFAILLLLTGEGPEIASRLSAACKRLEWEKRLTVFFRPLEAEPVPYRATHRAQRYALYNRAEKLVVADAPWVFLYDPVAYMIRQPWVNGYVLNPMRPARLERVWLSPRGARK